MQNRMYLITILIDQIISFVCIGYFILAQHGFHTSLSIVADSCRSSPNRKCPLKRQLHVIIPRYKKQPTLRCAHVLTIPNSRVCSKNVVDHHAFRFIHEIGPLFAVNMRDNVIMNISIRGGFLSDTERK